MLSQQKKNELSKLIHNEALSFSNSPKNLGELTVIPVGYVSQIALKFIDNLLNEKIEKIKSTIKNPDTRSNQWWKDEGKREVIAILKE